MSATAPELIAEVAPAAVQAEPEPILPMGEAALESPVAEDMARAVETARAEAAPEAFIPPAPIESPTPAPETRMIAQPVIPRPAPTRNRVSSLLARIRGNEEKAEAPVRPAPAPNPSARPAEAALQRTEASKAADPEQPSFGGLDANERIRGSQNEEDLLEIPAFLRRQAN
jgi:cell division protein FtsZ